MLQEIYGEYTDLVEPYGCDEAWLDVTGSTALKGDEKKIADEIRSRVKKELGITVSIGISWNKIFAKLGSDYKKPDAITQFHKENYQSIVWNLPAANLLYVGRSTRTMLNRYGIKTIGKIATSDPDFLERLFGRLDWSYIPLQMAGMILLLNQKAMRLPLSPLVTVPPHQET